MFAEWNRLPDHYCDGTVYQCFQRLDECWSDMGIALLFQPIVLHVQVQVFTKSAQTPEETVQNLIKSKLIRNEGGKNLELAPVRHIPANPNTWVLHGSHTGLQKGPKRDSLRAPPVFVRGAVRGPCGQSTCPGPTRAPKTHDVRGPPGDQLGPGAMS